MCNFYTMKPTMAMQPNGVGCIFPMDSVVVVFVVVAATAADISLLNCVCCAGGGGHFNLARLPNSADGKFSKTLAFTTIM